MSLSLVISYRRSLSTNIVSNRLLSRINLYIATRLQIRVFYISVSNRGPSNLRRIDYRRLNTLKVRLTTFYSDKYLRLNSSSLVFSLISPTSYFFKQQCILQYGTRVILVLGYLALIRQYLLGSTLNPSISLAIKNILLWLANPSQPASIYINTILKSITVRTF